METEIDRWRIDRQKERERDRERKKQKDADRLSLQKL